MEHLLTMLCTVSHRGLDGTDAYNRPTFEWEGEEVTCLYLTAADDVAEEVEGRGVAVTGKLYVMSSVAIEDGNRVSGIAHKLTGIVVTDGEFEVVRVKTEISPRGAHHKVAYLKDAERCS